MCDGGGGGGSAAGAASSSGPEGFGSDPGSVGGPDYSSQQQQAAQGITKKEDPNNAFWQQLVDMQRDLATGSFDFMNLIQPGMLERLGFTSDGGMSEIDTLINK